MINKDYREDFEWWKKRYYPDLEIKFVEESLAIYKNDKRQQNNINDPFMQIAEITFFLRNYLNHPIFDFSVVRILTPKV